MWKQHSLGADSDPPPAWFEPRHVNALDENPPAFTRAVAQAFQQQRLARPLGPNGFDIARSTSRNIVEASCLRKTNRSQRS
jgi:hypothetical protein